MIFPQLLPNPPPPPPLPLGVVPWLLPPLLLSLCVEEKECLNKMHSFADFLITHTPCLEVCTRDKQGRKNQSHKTFFETKRAKMEILGREKMGTAYPFCPLLPHQLSGRNWGGPSRLCGFGLGSGLGTITLTSGLVLPSLAPNPPSLPPPSGWASLLTSLPLPLSPLPPSFLRLCWLPKLLIPEGGGLLVLP